MLTPASAHKLREEATVFSAKAKTYRRWAIVLFTADELDLAEAIMAEAETFTRKSRSLYHAAHTVAEIEREHTTRAA